MICRKRYVKQTAVLDKKSLSMYNGLPPAIAYLAKQLLQKHTQTLYTYLDHLQLYVKHDQILLYTQWYLLNNLLL
jgi:hypothetical protein